MIVKHEPKSAARLKLFCFPYAGGTAAAYRPWNQFLTPEVELNAVELPGRPMTSREPITAMEPLIETIYPVIAQELDRPFIFYGHSFGSIVAFELCRKLQLENQQLPTTLFVSSRRAPHLTNSKSSTYQLPDDQFIQVLQEQYNAIPQAVLATPDLLHMLLPMLKADITINETYLGQIEPKLSIPVCVLYGDQDHTVDVAEMLEWKAITESEFTSHALSGGHFFINEHQKSIIKTLIEPLI